METPNPREKIDFNYKYLYKVWKQLKNLSNWYILEDKKSGKRVSVFRGKVVS